MQCDSEIEIRPGIVPRTRRPSMALDVLSSARSVLQDRSTVRPSSCFRSEPRAVARRLQSRIVDAERPILRFDQEIQESKSTGPRQSRVSMKGDASLMKKKLFALVPAALLAFGSFASAQTAGEIQGEVVDAQGLAMPGVTVTLGGEALLGEQIAVSLEDGSFRFRPLRRGSYNLRFELQGFQTLNREGIIVEGNRTVTLNVSLQVATISETVTVTGESPVVDVKNTSLSNEFGAAELSDVPSATDVWAVLSQTPGVRMRGYDVGGSHKSQQIGYESFRVRRPQPADSGR